MDRPACGPQCLRVLEALGANGAPVIGENSVVQSTTSAECPSPLTALTRPLTGEVPAGLGQAQHGLHMNREQLPQRLGQGGLFLLCVVISAWTLPSHVVGCDAHLFLEDDLATERALADSVAEFARRAPNEEAFHTGSARFDGEWAFGSALMSIVGLAQVVEAHPELRSRYLPAMEQAAEQLMREETSAFGRDAWGEGPLTGLAHGQGHAYMGYAALALGVLREVDPETRFAPAHDALVHGLARNLEASELGVLETYPGEAYPCDISSVVGAIGLHARLTGLSQTALIAREAALFRGRWIDPESGYLVQSVDPRTGAPRDAPRGSGTALSAFFWSFAEPSMSRELDHALLTQGRAEFAGFGGIREYGPGHLGLGDIDSGPVLFGVSVSATGFSLSAARRAGDEEAFQSLFRTAALFGVSVPRGEGARFLSGGPLGNAIMLAMLTARPV